MTLLVCVLVVPGKSHRNLVTSTFDLGDDPGALRGNLSVEVVTPLAGVGRGHLLGLVEHVAEVDLLPVAAVDGE